MSEKTIEGAEVTRREAVKIAMLAVGGAVLGGAGVAAGTPEEALAASKKKYKCKGCGKTYSTSAAMKKCLKKDADRDWAKIKKLTKEFASKSVPTFDTKNATLRKGTVYLQPGKGYDIGDAWFDIDSDQAAKNVLFDDAAAYNKKYAPSELSGDSLHIELTTALNNWKAMKGTILVSRNGGEWKGSKSSKVTVAAGETIQIKQKLLIHVFRNMDADMSRNHPSKYCCRCLTEWSEPFSYTNATKKKQKLELALFSENSTGGVTYVC